MKKNHVLVDFENVWPETVAELDKEMFALRSLSAPPDQAQRRTWRSPCRAWETGPST